MGKLSDIYSAYKASLDVAQDDYEKSVRERSEASAEFYGHFFKDLVVNLGARLDDESFRNEVRERIKGFFGKLDLDFIAVDGSCHKHSSSEFISFYGGAYGAKGTLSLAETPPTIEYKRWDIEKDVSMVAFVPVPYSRITELEEKAGEDQNFTVSEADRIELTSIHLPIMQLAEVFLAYNSATSSNLDSPDLILIDNSPSGMLGYTDFGPDNVRMIGHSMSDGRTLDAADVAVAQAHPFNTVMGIPSTKKFSLRFAVIKYLHDNPEMHKISVGELEDALGPDTKGRLKNTIKNMARHGTVILDEENNMLERKTDPCQSWAKTKSMFQDICKDVFIEKKPDALKYLAADHDGNTTMRWMSPDDVRFLIAVGLRALVEVCWERKILLTGIVKDSASAYLTRNYLGVCRRFGRYPQLAERRFGTLPPTDRLFCEILPYIDDSLQNPWGTIEFDSTFMTLRVERDSSGSETFGGTFSGITRQERLFLRSIAQFYTRRNADNMLTGHAIFIDRLVFPELDSGTQTLEIDHDTVGHMNPLLYPTGADVNVGQVITYFLLDKVTKNHFAEMIGYPDPLHKADQGAKSMRDSVKKLPESSEMKFRSRPLTNTLREIRQSISRRAW